jgi:ABC-2 type transport system permease protein
VTAHVESALPVRPPILRLSRVELRKMVDTRAGITLIAIVGLIAVVAVVAILAAGNADDKNLATMYESTVALSSILLPIVGILAVTSEWSQRTALATFTLVPERWRVMVAKVAASLLLGVLSVVACLGASAVGNAIEGGSWSLGASGLLYPVLYQLLSMLGGFALGALFLSSPLAIVMYFALPMAIGILSELIDAIPADWIDTSRTFAPLVENEMASGDWGRLAVSAAIWIVLPLVLGLLRLQRAEVKSA